MGLVPLDLFKSIENQYKNPKKFASCLSRKCDGGGYNLNCIWIGYSLRTVWIMQSLAVHYFVVPPLIRPIDSEKRIDDLMFLQ